MSLMLCRGPSDPLGFLDPTPYMVVLCLVDWNSKRENMPFERQIPQNVVIDATPTTHADHNRSAATGALWSEHTAKSTHSKQSSAEVEHSSLSLSLLRLVSEKKSRRNEFCCTGSKGVGKAC